MEKLCCLFSKNPKEFNPIENFSLVKNYGEIDAPNSGAFRQLVKCNNCNALFINQQFTWVNETGIDKYDDYIQVVSEIEADNIHSNNNFFTFVPSNNPSILSDKDSKYKLYQYKK